jgi:hypothetical protein
VKYNTAIPAEKKEAMSYFMRLINKKQIIEVKKVQPGRTLRQNAYLHLIIGAFGANFGYTLEEAKAIYKRVNKELYVYQKTSPTGETLVFVKSSADLTKEEMMLTIDKFRNYSAENGYPLPEAENEYWLRELENQVEQHNRYLHG